MAEEIVSQGPVSSDVATWFATYERAMKAERNQQDARDLLGLVAWAVQARQIADGVCRLGCNSLEMEAAFTEADIDHAGAPWSTKQVRGLEVLMKHVDTLLSGGKCQEGARAS